MFPDYEQVVQTLEPQIAILEQQRSAYRAVFWKGMLTLAITAVLTAAVLLTGYQQAVIATAILAGITLIVTLILLSRRYNSYRSSFKASIVTGVVQQLIENCELEGETEHYEYSWGYQQDGRISDHHIDSCCLFEERIDDIDGEDLIHGKLGLTDFEFSELKMTRQDHYTDSKGNRRTRTVTVFDGVLFVADFNKAFNGTTLLLTRGIWGTSGFMNRIGNTLKNLISSDDIININLENDAFNRLFDTNTSDEIEARYILSANFMERIVEFKQQHNEEVELAFAGTRMYVAIASGRNYFEPSVRRPTREQGKRVYEELTFFLGLIESFDLNTRIWSKA